MLKRILIFVFLVFAVSAGAQAQGLTVREFYVQELRNDGYDTIKISRTFLGRLRFIGTQPGRRREIVVNPANGAILRDYVRLIGTGSSQSSGQPAYSGGGGYVEGEYEDEYEDRTDNSGSGSSNSGSGSSNSGSGSSGSGSGSDDSSDDD